MRQSKTEFTCASPKKNASVRNGKQSLSDSWYVLLKRVALAGDSHFAQFGAYLLVTLYWNSIIHFQQNTGYYYVYSSHLSILLYGENWLLSYLSSYLSCSDAFAITIINIWPLKRKKGVWGGSAPSKARASNF